MEEADERIAVAPLPTARTVRMRTFIPYQLWRFAWVNLRMISMVGKGH